MCFMVATRVFRPLEKVLGHATFELFFAILADPFLFISGSSSDVTPGRRHVVSDSGCPVDGACVLVSPSSRILDTGCELATKYFRLRLRLKVCLALLISSLLCIRFAVGHCPDHPRVVIFLYSLFGSRIWWKSWLSAGIGAKELSCQYQWCFAQKLLTFKMASDLIPSRHILCVDDKGKRFRRKLLYIGRYK